jgi:hypothetical protein
MKAGAKAGGAVLLLLFLAGPLPAGEFYYLMVFASQREAHLPRHTHTFATLVRAAGPGPNPACYALQAWTISWMPHALEIQTLRLLPEKGVNLDLHTTLRWATADGQRVSMWGPFQVRKELLGLALRQIAHLQSGAVRYKAIDAAFRADRVSNCVHALTDLVIEPPRFRVGTRGCGESASFFAAKALVPWMIQPERTHDWLADRLGLANLGISRRGWTESPKGNPVLRAFQSLLEPSPN